MALTNIEEFLVENEYCSRVEDIAFVFSYGRNSAKTKIVLYNRREPKYSINVLENRKGKDYQILESISRNQRHCGNSGHCNGMPQIVAREFRDKVLIISDYVEGRDCEELLLSNCLRVEDYVKDVSDWHLEFMESTREYRTINESAMERFSKDFEHLHPGIDAAEILHELSFGPAHGDLVPSNVIFCDGRFKSVIDWESFDPNGIPLIDYASIPIVSIYSTYYYRNDKCVFRIENAKRNLSILSSAFRKLDSPWNTEDGFLALARLYSYKAISICERLGLQTQKQKHLRIIQDISTLLAPPINRKDPTPGVENISHQYE